MAPIGESLRRCLLLVALGVAHAGSKREAQIATALIRSIDMKLVPWPIAEARAEETVNKMTRKERFSLLRGMGWAEPTTEDPFPGFMAKMGYYTGNTPAIPRLGIPPLKMQDAAQGFRAGFDVPHGSTTAFPSLLALAATWDENVVYHNAVAIAREYKGKGANVILGPSIQVHRIMLGGRNFEYLSGDDPYLGSRLTTKYIKTMQSEGVMAVAKHFAFNEQESNRHEVNTDVDDRTAWELYYPPFQAAVDAGVCAFMCSYNRVNNSHACQNPQLLQRDLKYKMGFKGFVQADWGAAYRYKRAVERGLDQNMPGNDFLFTDETLASLREGAVEGAAKRVVAAIYRMRLDENPGCVPPRCRWERASHQRNDLHSLIAQLSATYSLVLLKNDGILPLKRAHAKKIAVLGHAANFRDFSFSAAGDFRDLPDYYSGGGSGKVRPGDMQTPLHHISSRASNDGMIVIHAANMTGNGAQQNIEDAVEAARMADIVIVMTGTSATEMVDRDVFPDAEGGQKNHGNHDELIAAVAKERPTVVLMSVPGAVMMPWLDSVAAVAVGFLPGEGTGFAWSQLLFGDSNPQGKLPISFPLTMDDTIKPGKDGQAPYTEGLFTSYRNSSLRVAFPFGHGLSYTRFEFGTPRVLPGKECGAVVCVQMPVTNVGHVDGSEVAQAYLHFPLAEKTPFKMLRGFHKTNSIAAGVMEMAEFNFTKRDLSIYDVSRGWVMQEKAVLHIGASSADIRHKLDLPDSLLKPPAKDEL